MNSETDQLRVEGEEEQEEQLRKRRREESTPSSVDPLIELRQKEQEKRNRKINNNVENYNNNDDDEEEEEEEEEEECNETKAKKLCKNSLLDLYANFSLYFSPFLLLICMILVAYASYVLITTSKLFSVLYVIFIIGALFIPNMGDSIMTHIELSIALYYNLIGNVSIVRYDAQNDEIIYGSNDNKVLKNSYSKQRQTYKDLFE